MKRVFSILMACLFLTGTANAATVFLEDFEDAAVTYTTSAPEFTDNGFDYFIRTDGSDHGTSITYSGFQGQNYFAGMDIDDQGGSLPVTMDFSDIHITGVTNLSFSAWFAEDPASDARNDWDKTDYVKIEYQIDNSGFQNLLAFENNGDTYNSAAFLDTDFDGKGDGTELTDIFSLFSADIGGTGDLLDLRISFSLNAGDEDIAIDNVMISGDMNAVPAPGAVVLLASGLAAITGLSRRFKN